MVQMKYNKMAYEAITENTVGWGKMLTYTTRKCLRTFYSFKGLPESSS